MTAAIAILDHDNWTGRADVIVWVQPKARRLTWIPRDLWSPLLKDRINCAVVMGGARLMSEALHELGFPCDSVLCLRRGATEALLREAAITVPIEEMLAFWCASSPDRDIDHGRMLVAFVPPSETLRGERIHHWIGARYMVNGAKSDLHRIGRQQIMLRAMLEADFDFRNALQDPETFQSFGEDPIPMLRLVDPTWEMTTFLSVVPETVGGNAVLKRVGTLPETAGG